MDRVSLSIMLHAPDVKGSSYWSECESEAVHIGCRESEGEPITLCFQDPDRLLEIARDLEDAAQELTENLNREGK